MTLSFEQFQKIRQQGNLSPEQIVHIESMQPEVQQPKKEEGFISRVGGELKERAKNIATEYTPQELNNKKFPLQKEVNVLGQVAGGVLDVAGEAIKSGYKTLVPEKTQENIKQHAVDILQTPVGQAGLNALKGGVEVWDKFSQANPEAAKYIGNVVNIASVIPVTAPVGETLSTAGKAIEKSGLAAADIAKKTLAEDIVKPLATKAIKLEQVKRTTETGSGLFKRSIVEPTKLEKSAAEEVAKIPEITAKNTAQQNYNIVKKYVVQEAKNLENSIKSNDFIISRKEVASKLENVAKDLSASPLIVGDAQKMAQRLINGAKQFVEKNSGSGSGLLKARKEFDQWVLSQKPKAFDAKAENAFTMANKAVRDSFNTILDTKATSVGVKDSLRKQSSLYNAMENIAPKAALEADTAIGRILQRAGTVLGIKNKAVQAIAAAVGIGGLGAAATFAPAAAATGITGYVLYQGGKFILNPKVRIGIGKLLQESGHLLNPADVKILKGIMEKTKGKGGLSIQDVSKKGSPTVGKTDPLIQEARKGKTIFHATDSDNFTIFDPTKAKKGESFFNPLGRGVYTSSNKDFVKRFGKNIYEHTLPADAKTKTISQTAWVEREYPSILRKTLKKLGIDYNDLDLGKKVEYNRLGNQEPIQALNNLEEQLAIDFGRKKPNHIKNIIQDITTDINSKYDAVIYKTTDYYDKADEIIINPDFYKKLSQPLQEGVKKSESVGLMRDAIRSDTKQYIKFLEKKLGDGKLSVEKYTQLDKRMETLKKVLKRIEAKKFTEEQYKKLQSYINKFKK